MNYIFASKNVCISNNICLIWLYWNASKNKTLLVISFSVIHIHICWRIPCKVSHKDVYYESSKFTRFLTSQTLSFSGHASLKVTHEKLAHFYPKLVFFATQPPAIRRGSVNINKWRCRTKSTLIPLISFARHQSSWMMLTRRVIMNVFGIFLRRLVSDFPGADFRENSPPPRAPWFMSAALLLRYARGQFLSTDFLYATALSPHMV